ncbi:MAG: hypothetical protein ACRDHL_00995 [Candidatus Promineifilaceae bacterium]
MGAVGPGRGAHQLFFCPHIRRPALITRVGQPYEITDPLTRQRCDFLDLGDLAFVQVAGDHVYYPARDALQNQSQIVRLGPEGRPQPLAFTRVSGENHWLLRYHVAADESWIIWSEAQPAGPAGGLATNLWLARPDGSERRALLENAAGDERDVLAPLRLAADGQSLYFTWEPSGIGGSWAAFSGRYDNLYRLALSGGEPELVFDCAPSGVTLCLGDFLPADGTLAYTDAEGVIHVQAAGGAALATIASQSAFAGYPTFNSQGGLIYYTAELSSDQGPPAADPGRIHYLASPYSGAPSLLAEAPGLTTPIAFLDEGHLLAHYADPGQQWGAAVVSLDGELIPVEPWPAAQVIAIWPAGDAVSAELLAGLTLNTTRTTSPDGRWTTQTTLSEPFVEADSGRELYFQRLVVSSPAGGFSHTVWQAVSGWGLGYTHPEPFFWSADGQRLYFTNVPVPDGCVAAANGSDLYRVELATGRVTQIFGSVGVLIGLAADESQAAYFSGQALGLKELASGAQSLIPFPDPVWPAAELRFGPDGSAVAVLQIEDPCGQAGRTSLTVVDVARGEPRRLIAADARPFRIQAWDEPGEIVLDAGAAGVWRLDVASGELREG